MKPMLATPSTGASGRPAIDIATLVDTHIFDLKLDGIRAILRMGYEGESPTLTNRNGVDITARFPDVILGAENYVNGGGLPVTLDGEIMAADNSFESVAIRDKQSTPAKVAAAMERMRCFYFAFDMLDVDNVSLVHQPWHERRFALDSHVGESKIIQLTPWSPDPAFLQQVREQGMEGVIAKRREGQYQPGRRSPEWIKFKCLHRITCIVTGYEPGQGSRSDFGAMFLALIDSEAGELVPVGRVGTGFRAADIPDLKEALDNQQVLLGEIECLNVTKTRQLRFPVWKGIRRDITPLDCDVEQLKALPSC